METAAAAAPRPSLGTIWAALDGVPDPEIPVISVLELGIVRAVEWSVTDPDTLIVRVTPTYSGCPATELIMSGIREAMTALGVRHVRLETQLAPAWTTDWMTTEAKQKLPRVRHRAAAGRWRGGNGRPLRRDGDQSVAPCESRRVLSRGADRRRRRSSRSSVRPPARPSTGASIASSRSTISSRTDSDAARDAIPPVP